MNDRQSTIQRDTTPHAAIADPLEPPRLPLLRTAVLYPNRYVWYVFFASLDIMCTWIILHLEGSEVNWIARLVIETGGLTGTVAYKFGLLLIVVCICEIVGRFNRQKGRRLAEWSVAITIIPVAVAFIQLVAVFVGPSADHSVLIP